MTLKCPKSITNCSNLVTYFFEKLDLPPGLVYKNESETVVVINENLIKYLLTNKSKIEKSITISKDGTVHLKFFDKKSREIYYRSSCGMQVVTINNKVISKINYLDDSVLCSTNICQIFENLSKTKG